MKSRTVSKPLFKNLIQVGMVVSDLKKSMHKYVFGYNAGPMYVLEFNPGNVSDMYLYGKKQNYKMNLAVCPIGEVRFELIEPITHSIYSDYVMDKGEDIIHHLKLGVDDYYGTISYLESIGIEVIQSGKQIGGEGHNSFTYLDTSDSLGFIIELVDIESNFIKPEPDRWFPDAKAIIKEPKFIRPMQIGIVVKNLDNKIEQYRDLFGLNYWTVKEFNEKNISNMNIYGKKKNFSVKAGFYSLENVCFKLIEPLTESIYSDFYNKHGEGVVHHLGMIVNDYHEMLNFIKSKGINIIQSGCYDDKFNFSYLSTDSDINFITEIYETHNCNFMP